MRRVYLMTGLAVAAGLVLTACGLGGASSGQQQALSYLSVSADGWSKVNDRVEAMEQCQSDLACSQTRATAARDEVRTFRAKLGQTTVPACLRSYDSDVRSALDDLDAGLGTMVSAIQARSTTQLDQALRQVEQAETHMNDAEAHAKALDASKC